MPMNISVIICTKNRFDDFKEAVKSLLAQKRLPDELIVVDASDEEIIQDYLDVMGIPCRYQYIHSSPGLTIQRNIGIAKSNGRLLFFFDDDVIINPEYIGLVERTFSDDVDAVIGAVGGRIVNVEESRQGGLLHRLKRSIYVFIRLVFLQSDFGSGRFRYSGMPTHPHLSESSRFIECLSGCCMAFRREVLDRVYFDEHLLGYAQLEDAEISLQVLEAGYGIYYEANALLEHKVSPQERVNMERLAEMTVLNYVYLFRKHFPQTPPRIFALSWTILGLILLYLPTPTGLRGVLRGCRRVLLGSRQ